MNECQAQCATRSAATRSVAQRAHPTHARRTGTTPQCVTPLCAHTTRCGRGVHCTVCCAQSCRLFSSSALSCLTHYVGLPCVCRSFPRFRPAVPAPVWELRDGSTWLLCGVERRFRTFLCAAPLLAPRWACTTTRFSTDLFARPNKFLLQLDGHDLFKMFL